MNQIMKEFKKKTTQQGLRVFLITLLVLISLVVVNILVGLLPKSVTELDVSADKIYSVSGTTKRSLAKLREDVTLYYLSAGGEASLVDESLQTKVFLDKLPEHSPHLSLKMIDTANDPTFAASLGLTETPENHSIVVKSAKRTRVLTQSDIFYYYIDGIGKMTATEAQQYVYMIQMYYGQTLTPTYHFDGEGQILSAIDYVTAESLPKAYAVDGHSEAALSATLTEQLSLHNIDVSPLTLIQTGEIPADCALLILNCPQTDLTLEEITLISAYLEKGGKLMLVSVPGISKCPNLLSLTSQYGLSAKDGIVIETNANYYKQYPFYLFPKATAHEATAEYASSVYAMLPEAHSIHIEQTLPNGVSASALFTTSENAYIIDVNAESIDCPEGQTPTTHNIGAVATAENGSSIVWISSYGITNDSASSYAAGGNYVYLLSLVKWLCGAEESISAITPLTLSTPLLTVPTASAGLFGILLVILIPTAIFVTGLVYWLKRRKK
ncbi:MAG: Gldg family protein [Clostridia bacterium]|nr:Gldg family protein [Clostridia bacterium]